MANHKSALKRAKQNEKRYMHNKTIRTRVKSVVKEVRLAASVSNSDAVEKLNNMQSVVDKAAKKGVIHRKTAARKISRLYALVNANSA